MEGKNMNIYELINPSDPYTFLAPDREVAALVCLFQGGQVGAALLNNDGTTNHSENEDVPMFFFGGGAEWLKKNYNRTIEESFLMHLEDCGVAMCTMLLGDLDGRRKYEETMALIDDEDKRSIFKKQWHEKRTSINDFGTWFRDNGEYILNNLDKVRQRISRQIEIEQIGDGK